MLRPKLLYFLYYAAAASLLPFLVLYYEQLGLSGRQIGVLGALLPLMTLFGVPRWSSLADKQGRHRMVGLVAIGGTIVFTLVTLYMENYLGLLLSVGALSLFTAPIMPLVDHITLTLLKEQRNRYGALRLWGAVGWGIAAPVTGFMTERTGLQLAFILATALLALLWAASYTLPKSETDKTDGGPRKRLPLTRAWFGFLLAAFTGGVCLAVSSTFLYLHMADLGIGAGIVGLALTVATLSELPVFWLSSRLLLRYPAPTLLVAALALFALRLGLYAFVTAPWLLLTIQLLHGATFSLLWVAGVAYAAASAPAGRGATAQGLFTATTMGLGGTVGALVGGVLYDILGASGMFGVVASAVVVICIGLGLLGFVNRLPSRQGAR